MSHVRVRRILVVLTIFALVLGSADLADAKKKRKKKKKNTVPTTLVIESAQGTHIAGTVESARSGCVDERKVEISRNGNPVASADADSEGQWFTRTGGTIANGDVIVAEIEKVTVNSKGKKVTCGSDSDRFVVGNTNNGNNGGNNGGPNGTETLTVTVTGPGTVTSNPPGINCRATSGTCVRDYPAGSTVSLTATPDNGATFDGWSGACGGTAQPCNVVMSTDRSVGATFTGAGAAECDLSGLEAIPVLGPLLCSLIG